MKSPPGDRKDPRPRCLAEISQLRALAFELEEVMHGPWTLPGEGDLPVLVGAGGGAAAPLRLPRRGGAPWWSADAAPPALQFLALFRAVQEGRDPGRPRRLTQAVRLAARQPAGEEGREHAFTRRAVELGHAAGVPVEGEIGHVLREGEPGWERPEAALTPPEAAERFAAETGVDSLAVAVGTVHGFYRGEPHIDLERLEGIRRRLPVPLVLHGGSGLPAELLGAAVAAGVAKVNCLHRLKAAWAAALRRAIEEAPTETDPRRLLAPALEAVRECVTAFIDAVGARGRAAPPAA